MKSHAAKLLIFILTLIITTMAVDHNAPDPSPGDSMRVAAWKDDLAQHKPRVVLLGNSMLGHGINEIQFSRLTGINTIKIWGGGVQSAWRHLALKNLLARGPHKPEVVVVFFREDDLTDPTFRVDGEYKFKIDLLRSGAEPDLDRLAYHQRRDLLANLVTDLWPLDRDRETVKPAVEDRTKRLVASLLNIETTASVNEATARVFAQGNLNPELLSRAQLEADEGSGPPVLDFPKQVGSSFLPLDIANARQAGVRLIYVRIKKLRYAIYEGRNQDGQSAEQRVYNADLREYLESQGLSYFDYSDDRRITVDMFGEGDHLNAQGRALFTQMLASDLGPILGAPDATPPFADLAQAPDDMVLTGEFMIDDGHAWRCTLPKVCNPVSDVRRDNYRSIIMLYEDGRPLGPGHCMSSEVATLGGGRFSHTPFGLFFSTSDNSDPNTNGRTYSVRVLPPR